VHGTLGRGGFRHWHNYLLPLVKPRYRLRVDRSVPEFADEFDSDALDTDRWLPAHLPQWSSRAQAAARYRFADKHLVLQITEDQPPWCPEFDGSTRVSSLQTGVYAGPAGSATGQHRFTPQAVVREEQTAARLYTPQYGLIEVRARANPDPIVMVAFWMIGYEDAPERSGEICVFEIFGRDVTPSRAAVGMGVHPFGDPALVDDFSRVQVDLDVTEFHTYAADWTPQDVRFFIDGQPYKTVDQSPAYPMQFMLGIYEFPPGPDAGTDIERASYPKEFVVDFVRASRRG
jgi:hypothetical protein